MIGLAPEAVYVYIPANGRLLVLNDRTQQLRWRCEGLAMDRLEPPKTRSTRANGDVLIVKNAKTVQAIRLSDGKVVWVSEQRSTNFTHIVTDHTVVVFDPDRHVMIVDIETGKLVREIPAAPAYGACIPGAAGLENPLRRVAVYISGHGPTAHQRA